MRLPTALFFAISLAAPPALAQASGRLQIHFINVTQGDAALVISFLDEKVLFDNGVRDYCHLPLSYLEQLGVDDIDYHIASHYCGHGWGDIHLFEVMTLPRGVRL